MSSEMFESMKVFKTDYETEPEATELATETEAIVTETETKAQEPEELLDFESLRTVNPEICAWIEIPGTYVDYPVLQSPTNDDKYLSAAYDGSYYIGGSLFTQATYNSNDFNDPVTLIYGHTMTSGILFGQLQSVYSDNSGFESHRDITLYVDGETRHYTVFAALPYKKIHILHTYDFSNDYWYKTFFKSVRESRVLGSNIDQEIVPQPGDRVIILSTCLNEDSTKRFLVMAVNQADLADNS